MWSYDMAMDTVELCWASLSLCVKLTVCVVQLFTLPWILLAVEVIVNTTS